jgi:hypothetical protein
MVLMGGRVFYDIKNCGGSFAKLPQQVDLGRLFLDGRLRAAANSQAATRGGGAAAHDRRWRRAHRRKAKWGSRPRI